jgi:hypothetical protein
LSSSLSVVKGGVLRGVREDPDDGAEEAARCSKRTFMLASSSVFAVKNALWISYSV